MRWLELWRLLAGDLLPECQNSLSCDHQIPFLRRFGIAGLDDRMQVDLQIISINQKSRDHAESNLPAHVKADESTPGVPLGNVDADS